MSAQAGGSSPPYGRASDWQEAADLLWLAVHAVVGIRDDHPSREPPSPSARSPERDAPSPVGRPEGSPNERDRPDPHVVVSLSPQSPQPEHPVLATPAARTGERHDDHQAATAVERSRRATAQALRTFRRLVVSPHGQAELDEEAAAERAAEDDLWLPVFAPPRERMLELDLVIDHSRLAMVQNAAASSFAAAAADAGAFRQIRVHFLDSDVKTEGELVLRCGRTISPARSLTLPGQSHRRLIVVLTDGTGDAWHMRAAHRMLARWGERNTIGVIHLLPPVLWRRTGLSPERAELVSPRSAAPAREYRTVVAPQSIAIPVIGTEPAQLRSWAEFVMGGPSRWVGAMVACSADEPRESGAGESEEEADLSPEERVTRFRLGASPTAFELAVHLAAAPLTDSVIGLVRRKLVPRATGAHLAEVLGSDLVRRGRARPASVAVPYDFAPGVRAELLQSGRRSATAEVVVAVADLLGREVRELRALRDVIVSPASATIPDLPEELFPLVDPALSAMEAMAGPYTVPARSIRAGFLDLGGRLDPPISGDASPRAVTGATGPYRYVVSNPSDVFGVTINMSPVPEAAMRESRQPTPVWNVPPKNVSFTGREDLLARLHDRLSTGTTAVLPEALHGLGGVGKSQIAIEYCYRHQDKYDLIWWIPSERLTMVRQAFVDLAVHLDLNVTEPNVAVPAVREALRLGRPYASWLLVFDNAEDVEQVRRFFPTNGPGKIMVTSRSRDWFAHATPLEVDVFTREESRALLRLRGPELSERDADEISERLGDLPLAIEQAAVWLTETGMPVAEYLQLFDEQRAELLQVEGAEVPVAAAWNVSFEQLRRTHPAALQLLQVCAFLAPEPIPRSLLSSSRDMEGPPELLAALRDPIAVSRTTRAINQFALAKLNHRDNTISLHRLVQRVVTSQLSDEERALFRHCGHLMLANADPRDPGNRLRWPEYHALFPHVFAARLEECPDPWARALFLNVVDFLFLWGDHTGFRALAQRAVDTWRESLGPDHDDTLNAELRLGRALRLFADFEGAYRHHLHARDVLRERLGTDHERTLEAQGYLGADLRYLGRFEEALEIDHQAYEILRRRFGPDDPLTLEQAHLLAIDYRLAGDPVKARELDRDTLRRKEEVLGPDSLSTISTRVARNIDVMECGDYLEARALQEAHSIDMRRRYQNSHPGTMDAIAQLSVMNRKAGLHSEALKLSEEAMSLYRARYGDKAQTTVAVALNHAINLRHNDDLSQSVEIGMQAKRDYEEIFGPDHPNSPTAAVNVAVSLRLLGRLEEARDMDRAALAELTRLLGPSHPRTLISKINYASDLFALGAHEEALELDREAYDLLCAGQGAGHPTALACAFNLSQDLQAAGREEEAARLLAESLAGYRRVLGDKHPAIQSRAQGRRANCDIYPISV
ncbi:FxSxx-COOH system tetratricopeptide repeat protein [Microbispora bryophytorum]|uniref:FxSxx-COOH system tetratricopeptide repeat protein n=1 Tax=Microbispora bryophytorum TaxID=1460882 RepID=UPI00340A127E